MCCVLLRCVFGAASISRPVPVCGGGEMGFRHGKCLTEAQFYELSAICVDSIHPMNYFVGDRTSIRYVDTETDTVSLVAGSEERDFADGIGAAARFYEVRCLLCTSDGQRLVVSDKENYRIRSVDLKTKAVAAATTETRAMELVLTVVCILLRSCSIDLVRLNPNRFCLLQPIPGSGVWTSAANE